MDNFNQSAGYTWEFLQYSGAYSGPTDDAALNASVFFNTSGFANAYGGTFALHLDITAGTLYLTYTPAP